MATDMAKVLVVHSFPIASKTGKVQHCSHNYKTSTS